MFHVLKIWLTREHAWQSNLKVWFSRDIAETQSDILIGGNERAVRKMRLEAVTHNWK